MNDLSGRGAAARRRFARRRRTGFSFPEVLFAVVVLGIGFIMIAGIFPVAIQQAKLTADETAAAVVARSGVAVMTKLAYDPRDPAAVGLAVPPGLPAVMPNTNTSMASVSNPGEVMPLRTVNGWKLLRGSLILREDPRYAFVPLYRRGVTYINTVPQDNGTAQLYVIGVQCSSVARPRLEQKFDSLDFNLPITPNTETTVAQLNAIVTENPNNLRPRRIEMQLTDNKQGDGVDIMMVKRQPTPLTNPMMTENLPGAIATGAYVITADDGRIYRVGLRRTAADDATHEAWELQVGSDMRDNKENVTADRPAWCVGRERLSDGSFVGPAQDISIYTAMIEVKP